MTDLGRAATGSDDGLVRSFFRSRWRGTAPLGRLIWRDMILVASALNAMASMLALGLLGAGVPSLVALPVHFAFVPYNLFLALCVWRTAERMGASTVGYMLLATAWLVLVTIV